MHTSHVSTATRVYLCSAAVTEAEFLLTASITFTDLHSQVGLTCARCAQACPTSTLLKNTLTPAQPRRVSALVLIYCVRLREPWEELMHADYAPWHPPTPSRVPKAACRASLGSYASQNINTSKAMERIGGLMESEGNAEMIKQGGVREKRTVIGGEKERWENPGRRGSVCVSLTFVGGSASHGTSPHSGLCCCLMATRNSTGDRIKSSFPQMHQMMMSSVNDDDSPECVRAPVWWAVVLLIWM